MRRQAALTLNSTLWSAALLQVAAVLGGIVDGPSARAALATNWAVLEKLFRVAAGFLEEGAQEARTYGEGTHKTRAPTKHQHPQSARAAPTIPPAAPALGLRLPVRFPGALLVTVPSTAGCACGSKGSCCPAACVLRPGRPPFTPPPPRPGVQASASSGPCARLRPRAASSTGWCCRCAQRPSNGRCSRCWMQGPRPPHPRGQALVSASPRLPCCHRPPLPWCWCQGVPELCRMPPSACVWGWLGLGRGQARMTHHPRYRACR